METIRSIEAFRSALGWRRSKRTLGLAMTQGNLHDGHVALFKALRDRADISVACIYVNPLCFETDDDFLNYPRPLDTDTRLLESLSVDFLFAPLDTELFPDGAKVAARLTRGGGADALLEAQGTLWLKLVNIIEPDLIICGEKNYAQLVVLKRLAREFFLNVEITPIAVARDSDGVALSAELDNLTAEQRKQAPILHQTLIDLAFAIKEGARNYSKLEQTARIALRGGGFDDLSVHIRDADTWSTPATNTEHLRIVAEADLGLVRLNDNIGVDL